MVDHLRALVEHVLASKGEEFPSASYLVFQGFGLWGYFFDRFSAVRSQIERRSEIPNALNVYLA